MGWPTLGLTLRHLNLVTNQEMRYLDYKRLCAWLPRKKQQCWHYNTYEKARLAYPGSMPCGLRRPDKIARIC